MARASSVSYVGHHTVLEVDHMGARGGTGTAPALRATCYALETPPPEIYYDLDRDFALFVCSGQHTFCFGGIVHEPKDAKEQRS